jgi:ankyrin repeat protein
VAFIDVETLNTKNQLGDTALMVACRFGSEEMVKGRLEELLARERDIKMRSFSW